MYKMTAVAATSLVLGIATAAHAATIYTSDPNLAHFTASAGTYATLSNFNAGDVGSRTRDVVRAVFARDLDLRPLSPQIQSGRGFDDVDDEGAADAGGGLEKDEAVGSADELGMRTARC